MSHDIKVQNCLIQIGGEWFRFDGFDEDGDYWLERILPPPLTDYDDWEPTEDYRPFKSRELSKAIRKFANQQGDSWVNSRTHTTWTGARIDKCKKVK